MLLYVLLYLTLSLVVSIAAGKSIAMMNGDEPADLPLAPVIYLDDYRK